MSRTTAIIFCIWTVFVVAGAISIILISAQTLKLLKLLEVVP